jgi:hypothetical protein
MFIFLFLFFRFDFTGTKMRERGGLLPGHRWVTRLLLTSSIIGAYGNLPKRFFLFPVGACTVRPLYPSLFSLLVVPSVVVVVMKIVI